MQIEMWTQLAEEHLFPGKLVTSDYIQLEQQQRKSSLRMEDMFSFILKRFVLERRNLKYSLILTG